MSNDSSQVESVNATQAVEDEQKETYSATRWVITGILWFLVGLPGLMSILGFIGGSWWMNTLANFRTQYVLLFAVMLLVTLVFRRFVLSLVCLLLAIASFLPIVPTFNSNVQANVDNGPSVKIVLMNVAHQYNQTEYQPAADLVSQEKPQLLLLQEVDKGWLTEFYDLVRDDYDLVSDGARPDHYGIALLARTTGDNIVKVRGAKSWPLTWRDESDALMQSSELAITFMFNVFAHGIKAQLSFFDGIGENLAEHAIVFLACVFQLGELTLACKRDGLFGKRFGEQVILADLDEGIDDQPQSDEGEENDHHADPAACDDEGKET